MYERTDDQKDDYPVFAELGFEGEDECRVYARDVDENKSYLNENGDRIEDGVIVIDKQKVRRFGHSSPRNGASSYMLASYDKDTEKWEFKPLQYVKVTTSIKKTEDGKDVSNLQDVQPNTVPSGEFRSGKFIRKAAKQSSAVVGDDSIDMSGLAFSNIKGKISESTAVKKKTSERNTDNFIIPERNSNAKNVSEIYDIKTIIPYNKLTNVNIEELESRKFSPACSFINDLSKSFPWLHNNIMKSLNTPNVDKEYLKILVYASYMFKLYTIYNNMHKIQNIRKTLDYPHNDVYTFLLTNYAESCAYSEFGGFRPSMPLKNKLLSHIMCVALMISNYNLIPDDLSIDLKEPVTRIIKLAKLMGCKLTSIANAGNKRKKDKILTLTR